MMTTGYQHSVLAPVNKQDLGMRSGHLREEQERSRSRIHLPDLEESISASGDKAVARARTERPDTAPVGFNDLEWADGSHAASDAPVIMTEPSI